MLKGLSKFLCAPLQRGGAGWLLWLLLLALPATAQELLISDFDGGILRYHAPSGAFENRFDPLNQSELMGAQGLAIAPDGMVYVCSGSGSSILRFDQVTGDFVDVFADGLELNYPYSVAIGPDSALYVANYLENNILRYDRTTRKVKEFVISGSGGLIGPKDLLFGNGSLYVASYYSNLVLRYNATTGAYQGRLDTTNAGNLITPAGLAFGSDGNLYVSDDADSRILRFNPNTGNYLGDLDPTNAGNLQGPTSLAAGADGTLYVANTYAEFPNIVRYDLATGTPTTFLEEVTAPTYLRLAPKPAAATLFGTITLLECLNSAQTITFQLRSLDGGGTLLRTASLDAEGRFLLTDVPYGNYQIAIKGAKWLQKVVSFAAFYGYNYGLNAELIPGDANNDNSTDIFDLATLAEDFNSGPTDPNWNGGRADFNCDNNVDIFDLAVLAEYFNTSGDP